MLRNRIIRCIVCGALCLAVSGVLPSALPVTIPDSTVTVNAEEYNGIEYTTEDGEITVTGCTKYLTSVKIPSSINGKKVTKIGDNAFADCIGLKSITISAGIKTLEASAFSNCTALESITLPVSVTKAGNYVFSGCTSLTSVTLSEKMTEIPFSAFSGCTALKSIVIPDSVTNIDSCAFDGCTKLESVTLPRSLSGLGYSVFRNCQKLGTVKLPSGLSAIDEGAFENCTGLRAITIPNKVGSIGCYAFNGCTALSTITIPDSVTIVGHDAFTDTAWLDSQPDGVVYAGRAVYLCKNDGESKLDITIKSGTRSISDGAFSSCYGLNTISLPYSITSIGDEAFEYCTGLHSINLRDSLTSIGARAFYGCTRLKTISFPTGALETGAEAFSGTAWYKSQAQGVVYAGKTAYTYKGEIPENTRLSLKYGTKTVASGAFEGMTALTEVSIPGTVTRIGSSAFSGCTSLKAISVPDSVTEICDHAFAGCISMSTAILPPTISTISEYAFYRCFALDDIVIPDSVTSIEDGAFYGCKSLSSITIPEGVTEIGTNAFYSCPSLSTYNVDPSNEYFSSRFGALLNKDKTVFLRCPQTKYNTFNIPSGVKEIGEGAFSNCSKLEHINIPLSVQSIGYSAFSFCSSLKSISIPDTVTNIGSSAFFYCTDLASAELSNNLSGINEYEFFGCQSLETISLPYGITSVGSYAFSGCLELENISIPVSVTKIEGYSFNGTKWFNSRSEGLVYAGRVAYSYKGIIPENSSITLRSNTVAISSYAFANQTGLEKINMNDKLVCIGRSAFENCTGLKSVTIPKSVRTISEKAFFGCSSLESLTVSEGIDNIKAAAFMNCGSLDSVTLPSGIRTMGVKCFGFELDEEFNESPVPGFTVISKTDTAGEAYAKANSLAFRELEPPVPVTRISLNKSSLSLGKGETVTLTATVSPANASDKSVAFRTSNSGILTVDKNGNVKAVGKGTAWITARASNGLESSCKITVKAAPYKITLTKSALTVGVGENITLGSTVNDGSACSLRTYRTSNSSVVKMTRTDWVGSFTAVKPGTAYVTVRSYNGLESSCKVTVKPAPENISLTKSVLTLGVGETYSLGSTINNGSGCSQRTYRTSNSSVVKMTRTDWVGNFTAVKPGVAYVTVRTYNGLESSCKVTVKAAPTSVSLSRKSMTLRIGQHASLNAVIPSDCGCSSRTFRTSNNSIVKMTRTDWVGEFKAVKPGVAYITVRTYNGKEASCKVTVTL